MVESETKKETKKPNFVILKDEKDQQAMLAWYRQLHGYDDKGEAINKPHRGIRAELKRCVTVDAVVFTKSFFALSRQFPHINKYGYHGLAVVAAALALVEENTTATLPELLGTPKPQAEKPIYSELRFRRLLASSDADSLLRNLRSALSQTNKRANALLLADSILHWDAEQRNPDWYQGDRRWQYQWSKTYFCTVLNIKEKS